MEMDEEESFYFQYSNTGLCKRNKRALESITFFNKRVLKLFFRDVSNTDAPLYIPASKSFLESIT